MEEKMEKGKISSLQMAIMMYPTIVATVIISVPAITAKYAHNDLWLSPIIASVNGFVTVYIAFQLHKFYPQLTVIQFSEKIMGRFVGKMIGFLILFFYIQSTGQILRSYSELLVSSFLLKTPISVIMITMILLCGIVVSCGIEVLGRAAQVFMPAFFIPLLIFIFLLSPEYHFKNIFPILADGLLPPIKGAMTPLSWFSEFFLIIFLLPFLSDVKKGKRFGMITVIAVMMTLVAVNLMVLFVLGSTTSTWTYPLITAGRYIGIADFFENLESIAMAVWILGAFIKISVFFYACAIGTAQWLKLSDYRPIVWPLGILFVEFGFWGLPNSNDYSRFLMTTLPFYGTFMQTVIPLFLLIIAAIKNRKRNGVKSS
jgi:spore germination protein KB